MVTGTGDYRWRMDPMAETGLESVSDAIFTWTPGLRSHVPNILCHPMWTMNEPGDEHLEDEHVATEDVQRLASFSLAMDDDWCHLHWYCSLID